MPRIEAFHTRGAAGDRRTSVMFFLLALVLSLFSPLSRAGEWGRNADTGGEGKFWFGEIVIGATLPLTGAFEYYGQSAYYGAVARVRQINASGGIHGKLLVVEWRDNQSNPDLAAEQVEELVRDIGVPAVIGPLLSDSASAVVELAEKYRFVAISPMSTSNTVVQDSGWIFRTSFNNTAQAEGLVRFQRRAYGSESVGILYDPRYGFSPELAGIFARRFAEEGGRVTENIPLLDEEGGKNIELAVARLAEKKPDFIFAPLYALEAVEMMNALRKLDIDIRVCGSDTWDNELVFDASGRRLVNTSFASPLFEQTYNYRPFQSFFEEMERAGMENPDAQAACAWDAVSMLAEAFKKGTTAEALRDGLAELRDLPLATGRTTVLPDHETRKPVLVRVVEEKRNRLIPVFADRYDMKDGERGGGE